VGAGGQALRGYFVKAAQVAVVLFGPEGKGSFNESGLAGAERARALGHAVAVHWVEPVSADKRAQALRAICATSSPDLLVAHGGQGDLPVAAVHGEFPGTQFAITQGGFTGFNTASVEVLQEQSAFLAGVLAGLATTSGVVGHLSGEKVRPGLKGRAAFAHGLRASGRPCRFLTLFCGGQHDPELAYRAASALQRAGADLVFAMIDGGRAGVSQACREGSMRQIGNVLDWVARDPEVFVASAVADSGRCVTSAIDDFVHGRLTPGSHRAIGLESPDAVRLVMAPSWETRFGSVIESFRSRLLKGDLSLLTEYDGEEFDWQHAQVGAS
jgi:basic membrane protein A and related proteins